MHANENDSQFWENKNYSRNHLSEIHEQVKKDFFNAKDEKSEGNSLKRY